MHEPALAAALLNLAQQEITRAGYSPQQVISLTVKIGALRGVVEESLLFAFAALRQNSPLEKAELQIEKAAVKGHCPKCGAQFSPQEALFICSACGSGELTIEGGNELDLVAFTVAEP